MITINDDKKEVYAGIQKNADIVGSTMGPYGRNVTVDLGHGMATFKDGVGVSKLMKFSNPWERMGSHIVTTACRRTVELAGDGTTATAVLVRELCKEFKKESELRDEIDMICERIRALAIPIVRNGVIDRGMLYDIAMISSNGRADISKLITDVRMKIGVYGQIKVEHGDKLESEILSGYAYRGNVLAHQFFNGANKLELENCRVVLVNEEIQKIEKLKEVLGKNAARVAKGPTEPLVIVCGATGGALSTLAGNIQRFKNGEKVPEIYLVSLPEFGEERHEMMDDMAAIYGTRVFNHMRGMELKTFVDADFGSGRLSVKNGMVFCFSDRNIDSHIEFVKEQGRAKRLALLTGGIGIIRIGGETELEATNNQEIIDDTVRAVGSAMESGVVPGGGRCLESLGIKWLRGPKEQIWKNAGIKCPVEKCSPWRGRLIGGEEVDLLQEGIIDPAKVVISSVRSAGSAAIQFMTTKYFLKYDA